MRGFFYNINALEYKIQQVVKGILIMRKLIAIVAVISMMFIINCNGDDSSNDGNKSATSTTSTSSTVTSTSATTSTTLLSGYTITGTISGDVKAGVTVTLDGMRSSATTTDANGNYSFIVSANGIYTITPAKTGYTFYLTTRVVDLNNSSVAGQDFTATANAAPVYNIYGTISGDVLSGVTVTLSGKSSSSLATDAGGSFVFTGAANGNYTLTVSKTGYTFTPASISLTVNNANVTGNNFTARVNTYTVSGTITSNSAAFAGATVTLTGSGSVSMMTNSGGSYAFTGLANGNYTLTASKTGYTLSPASISITVNNANVTGQNFTATENTYTISGTVSLNSAGMAGVTVTLTGTGSNSTTTDASGNYSFSGATIGNYTLTASKQCYTFNPVNINVTVNDANLTGNNFTVAMPSGSLDPTFGTCGIVTTRVGNGNAQANAVAIQSNGKIVTAGYAYNGSNDDFAVVRYNADGSLDSTFGTGGIVTTPVGSGNDYASALGIQSDGKIVVAGYAYLAAGLGYKATATLYDYNIIVVRYNTNGSLDTTFGTGGIAYTDLGYGDDFAYALGIQSDGKIVVAGQSYNGINDDFAVVRYNTNGSRDTTFGTDGMVATPVGSGSDGAYALGIQSDGKIVLAGYSSNDFAIVRYNTNGSLDTAFDGDTGTGNGMVTTDFGDLSSWARSLRIQSDGKIVIAGQSHVSGAYVFTLIRYNTDGTLDTAFDGNSGTGNGIVTTSISGADDDEAYALGIQSNGKIVAAGFYRNGVTIDDYLQIALARYNTYGSLDTSFGTGGRVTTDAGSIQSIARAVGIQSDAKIVAAGNANGLFTVLRYYP